MLSNRDGAMRAVHRRFHFMARAEERSIERGSNARATGIQSPAAPPQRPNTQN